MFVNILRDISKEDTVEYVLALIDEMLSGNKKIFCISYPLLEGKQTNMHLQIHTYGHF